MPHGLFSNSKIRVTSVQAMIGHAVGSDTNSWDGKVADNDEGTIDVWQLAMLAGPVAAFVLPLLVTSLLGGFDDFELVNKPVTFWQALAALGAMSFPFGAYLSIRRKWNQARVRMSRTWPTVPGKVQSSKIERRIT